MYLDQIVAASPDTALIARTGLAAGHWEAVLAAQAIETGVAAWSRPPLTTLGVWLADRWDSARRAGSPAHDRCLLSVGQATRLWQRIIEESPEGAGLISPAQIAVWAQLARKTLLDHGLSGALSRRPRDLDDSAVFDRWHRRFDAAIDEAGWVDPESLLFRLNRLPVETEAPDVILLDPALDEPPELSRLREVWQSAGRRVTDAIPDGLPVSPELLVAADVEDELRHASNWAAGLLERQPRARVAIVVPEQPGAFPDAERLLVERHGRERVSNAAGRPLGEIGIVGAARNALRLLSPRADFAAVSRWLRSPFFTTGHGEGDADERGRRAALEQRLRSEVWSQQGFLDAWRAQGLRAEFRRTLPELAKRLDEVLERLPHRATPSRWVELWQASLKTLGWSGILDGLERTVADAWERSLAGVAELTAITGLLDAGAALDELDRVVGAARVRSPVRLHGIHLLRRIGDVGPGFAGAWVTGFSEQSWPEPISPNPLVPWSLQIEHRLAAARPDSALTAAAAELDRLYRRTPALVLSCPECIVDQPQVPHPRFDGWRRPEPTAREARTARHVPAMTPFAESRIGTRRRERTPDTAPPLHGSHIPGGVRTLDLQSAIPLRAFCESRLRVRALDPVERGIGARRRGTLLHRALELLHRPQDPALPRADVAQVISIACGEVLPPGDAFWRAQVEAERARLARLLTAWLEAESRRDSFRTVATEKRTDIEIAGWHVGGRIDRLDRLDSGDELLLDYKSGKPAKPRWFDERLGDCQLPLYAQRPGLPVAAIVLAVLNEDGARFRTAGRRADAVPGSQHLIEGGMWEAQIERWRDQLHALIEEFAAGDVRVPVDGEELDGTLWAAVARKSRAQQ